MKKIKLNSKLVLNKETIATLNKGQMQNVYGGEGDSWKNGTLVTCHFSDKCGGATTTSGGTIGGKTTG